MIRKIFSAGLLIFPLLILVSCRNSEGNTEEEVRPVTPVTVTPVVFKTIKSTIDFPAVSSFLRKSTIRATVNGYLQEVDVVQGDKVTLGQLLFSIRTKESMALGDLKDTDSTLAFRGLINIKSPGRGVVTSVKYQSGAYVQEGDELATVADQGSLVFILELPVEMDRFIPSNRQGVVELPDSQSLKGTITGKLPEMNLETQSVKYLIRVASSADIPENLIANVPIVKAVHENALVLPVKAVLSNETQTEFWVMKLLNDSVAVKTIVQKGLENDNEIEIKGADFHTSDRIILTGNYGLPDTAAIKVTGE